MLCFGYVLMKRPRIIQIIESWSSQISPLLYACNSWTGHSHD